MHSIKKFQTLSLLQISCFEPSLALGFLLSAARCYSPAKPKRERHAKCCSGTGGYSAGWVFVIGALLIVTGVLVLTLIESKKARAEVAATLGSSVVRQNALSQELRAEIEEINKQNLLKMAAVSKDHHYEMENLWIILSIAEQDLDAALKVASKATQ